MTFSRPKSRGDPRFLERLEGSAVGIPVIFYSRWYGFTPDDTLKIIGSKTDLLTVMKEESLTFDGIKSKDFYKMRQHLSLFPFILFLLLAFFYVGCRTVRQTSKQSERYVVVLSLDGFRPDYTDRARTPALDRMAQEGLSGSLQPCFPSLTFPNHYSMATGLYPDHHGIVANEFVDSLLGIFRISDRKAVETPGFWGGEPVWNTAARQGIRTGVYFWVGSETAVNGNRPWRWKKFSSTVPFRDRADSVIAWLGLPEKERPRLLMWYIEEPDMIGHSQTPESRLTLAMVERLDSVVGYFRKRLDSLPIAAQTDFIIVSDHGMATYENEKCVNLSHYLPADSFLYIATGAFTHLYPKPSYTERAYEILRAIPHISVYRKGEVPKRLRCGTNPRLGELVVIPDIGSTVFFAINEDVRPGAAHGYDNQAPEMRALLRAVGPDFRPGSRVENLPNITIYPLICRLLGIEPAPNDADETLLNGLIRDKRP